MAPFFCLIMSLMPFTFINFGIDCIPEVAQRGAQVQLAEPPPPPVPAPPPPNTIEIPAIGLTNYLFAGGQSQLDQGLVVLPQWSAYGYPNSCLPHQGCTVWVAGHRTTHGAVFNRVPELRPGDLIAITDNGVRYTYAVTHSAVVSEYIGASGITGDLILQTSWTSGTRYFVYGTLIS